MALTYYKDTSMRLGLTGLVDIDNTEVIDATVTATVYDSADNEVTGQSFPATLAHDADGNYYVTLSASLSVDVRKKYYIEVVAVSGSIQKTWRVDLIVEYAQ